jgi:outer membrane biosynthesis protein TonB
MKVPLRTAVLCPGVLSMLFCACVLGFAAENKPDANGNRPLQIIRRAKLDFPSKLIGAGVTSGEVMLYLDVDAEGKLADHLIVAYTHFEFANMVSKTVARWRFAPAMIGGRAVAATVALNLRFEVDGLMVSEQTTAEQPTTPFGEYMFRARALNELDRVPRPLVTHAPLNPAGAGEPAVTGRARVDFFIDEQGRVRMPRVAFADDERLGWSAVAAIAKWEFEVPHRSGFPVLARASQVFSFAPED